MKKNKKIELGYKSIFRTLDTDYFLENFDTLQNIYVNDTFTTNHFVYNENIHAVYGIYKQNIKKLGVQLGLRLEQANTESDVKTTEEVYKNDYFSFFPTVHMNYKIDKKQEVNLSYSRRINRPRTRAMNPFSSNADPLNIRKGNPYLKPEYIDSYEIEYIRFLNKSSISIAAFYKKTVDMISRFKTIDSAGITTSTWTNFASGQSYGMEFIANAMFYKWWNMTLSSNFYQHEIDGSNIETDMNTESFGYSVKLLSNWKITKKIDFQTSFNYRSPKKFAQGEMDERYNLDLSVKKKILNDKGSISIRITDVFDTKKFNYEINDPLYYQKSTHRWQSRMLHLSFSYTFGRLKEKKQRKSSNGGGNGMEDFDI